MKNYKNILLFCIGVSALAFCILLAFLTDISGLNLASFIALVLLPFTISSVSFIALKLGESAKTSVIYSILGFVAFFYFIEGILTGLEFGRDLTKARQTHTREQKVEAVVRLRKQGINAYPNINMYEAIELLPGLAIPSSSGPIFPLAGIADVPVVYCDEGKDHFIVFDSDEYGFRNKKDIWSIQNPDIGFLGSSYAVGACVEAKHSITGILNKQYGTAVNAARGGIGLLHELAILSEYLSLIKPKRVLWVVKGESEFRKLSRGRKFPMLRRYLDSEFRQHLPQKTETINDFAKKWVDDQIPDQLGKAEKRRELAAKGWAVFIEISWKNFLLLRRIRKRLGIYRKYIPLTKRITSAPIQSFNDYELGANILGKAKRLVGSWGGEFALVMLPMLHDAQSDKDTQSRKEFLKIAKKLGIPVIDVFPALRNEKSPRDHYTSEGYHSNERGYRLMAETIIRELKKMDNYKNRK